MIILPYMDCSPLLGSNLAAADTAALIGRTTLGHDCYIGEMSVVRADGEKISIGNECWFDDLVTVHIADSRLETQIGNKVSVGRYALVHACTVKDKCIVGENSVIMDGAVLEFGAVIAADSLVPPGKHLPGGWLYAGVPAKPIEKISPDTLDRWHQRIRTRINSGEQFFSKSPVSNPRNKPGSCHVGKLPRGCYIAPTASLVGQIELEAHSSLWFGVDIDAGDAKVRIGMQTNIQDHTRIYGCTGGVGVDIGERVLVGHNVHIYPSIIGADAIIGMGAVISPGTWVQPGACVAAGAITEPGSIITSGHVWSGRPAQKVRDLSRENRVEFTRAVNVYREYAENYLSNPDKAPPNK